MTNANGTGRLAPSIGTWQVMAAGVALVVAATTLRWFFGLAGFLGLGDTGPWSAANLDAGAGAFDWFGRDGVVTRNRHTHASPTT